jgi:diguanylate cyclase (GGDEF)-like protein/PAS domain S-box-containing protein
MEVVVADGRNKKSEDAKIKNPVHFPDENPNPVLRVDANSIILYANTASQALLDSWYCQRGQALPERYQDYIRRAHEESSPINFEAPANERFYSFTAAPIHSGFTNLYGHDITERKGVKDALVHSKERYRMAQVAASIGSWDWDIASRKVIWSETIEPLFGLNAGEFQGTFDHFIELVHPADRQKVEDAVNTAISQHVEYEFEHRIIHPHKKVCWMLEKGTAIYDEAGQVLRMIGIVQDITQRVTDEQQIKLLSRGIEQSPAAIIITDASGIIEYVNPKFTQISGYRTEEVVGKTPSILKSGKETEAFYRNLWETILSGNEWHGEYRNRTRSGNEYWASSSISSIQDGNGQISHFLSVQQDITDKKTMEERITHLALHDMLTGLPNRTLFRDRLRLALNQSERSGKKTALLFIDLDNFKPINDALGHEAGDIALQTVADRIKECLRQTDTPARMGGDEFAVILPNIEDSRLAGEIAGRILELLTQPINVGEQVCNLGASIGISIYPDHAATIDMLIDLADEAMYNAKNANKGTYRYYGSE